MKVITRFAPSPTGFLHIGGARTALFNYLFAKHYNGQFLLRIEDTDKERNSQAAINAILDELKWLGLNWDGPEIYQSARLKRHQEMAHILLQQGKAYHCYTTQEELAELREQAAKLGKQYQYDGRWRDRDPNEIPKHIKPTIRLKSPRVGKTIVDDKVQGKVITENSQMDDMILLRSDGSPTYMFAVVVDDHDMGITHIIRGDDHLTNTARQMLVYQALDWDIPEFAHIPLIHGPDGSKLSKRHGALGIDAYRQMGYLSEAIRNYLLRLGWSHGDDEFISNEQAISWFNLEAIGQSPSRIDFKKLENVNAHYLKNVADAKLVELITKRLEKKLSKTLNDKNIERLIKAMKGLKVRAKNLNELADNAFFYVAELPLEYSEKAKACITKNAQDLLSNLLEKLLTIELWQQELLQLSIKEYADSFGVKLGDIAQILRAALTGSTVSPSVFEIMEVFGKEETIKRLSTASIQKNI